MSIKVLSQKYKGVCVCVRFVNILCGGGPFWRVNRWWRALRPFLKAGNARQIKLHEHTHTLTFQISAVNL